MDSKIYIKGARINNLKNMDVEIPRNKLVVITGLSGSGKSSLAFDTLYAEGQRRYVESLSSYARQFLGKMGKPECDYIKGIPPAIAIEQKVNTRNPRSTVGTSTEIYDYLRMLFARVGKTISPKTGLEVKKHSVQDVISHFEMFEDTTRAAIYAPLIVREGRTIIEHLEILLKQGFNRIEVNREIEQIQTYLLSASKSEKDSITLLVDRMTCQKDQSSISRISDSLETAFFEGDGEAIVRFYLPQGVQEYRFSKKFEADGIRFHEPSDLMFNFNSPAGACLRCEGFGKVLGIDENLVIPNKALSVYEGAVYCWRGEKMSEWLDEFIQLASPSNFPIHKPYFQLTENEKELLWYGTRQGEQIIPEGGATIDRFFKMLDENKYKIQYRVMTARYQGKTSCPICKGSRLKPEAAYVKVGGHSIQELVKMQIDELKLFFEHLQLSERELTVANRLLKEISNRIHFLIDVGLGYLTLDRLSNTLSGGESQRINLATSLGSSLVGALYILDEPSIGLHSRDTDLLIKVLKQLKQLGNTVVVVEHDEEIIRSADCIIDIGPDAGIHGGEVVYSGVPNNIKGKGHTMDYLLGNDVVPVPKSRRKWNSYIEFQRVSFNNLKGFDVKFPLRVMTVVTGVSGSGKSTLTREVFYKQLKTLIEQGGIRNDNKFIKGDFSTIKSVEFVDQNPIGKSSRSNPCTYLKAYDEIRKLFADQTLSKQMGFTPTFFSFNSEGGRCEECKGDGITIVSMQFMADLSLVCESCQGKRFKSDVLEVTYRDKTIYDILEMSIDEAILFFGQTKGNVEKKIVKRLQPLLDVGLGYVKMGQSSSTLSGGESQRVKLAFFLAMATHEHTVFVFDEPTTGLHFHDVHTLLRSFDALIAKGHTVIIIEHNLDIIKCADHIIDLGPEGGDKGGQLVASGTPEEIVENHESITGKYLKSKL